MPKTAAPTQALGEAVAEPRVVLDGQPLSPSLGIESQSVRDLYPDDVYNVVVTEELREGSKVP